MKVDYLIVGSGLTGATIARLLADNSREVMVLDRRSHVGGNVHDHAHPSGIRVHTYGPHYFRTNSEEIWTWANRFGSFYKYEASLKSLVDGAYENWPIAASYIRRTLGNTWQPDFVGTPANFEEASLSMMPRPIYEKFVRGYSEKQWGTPAVALSANLARRFDVREDDEPRLMRHRWQGIPEQGYAAWTSNMLAGIPVLLNYDYLRNRATTEARKLLVFTGPIDEYYEFDLGRLHYRGQRREHSYYADIDHLQPCGQVNNPSAETGQHIRTLEWKHMMEPQYAARIKGTVITREVTYSPSNPEHYEYPFPDERNSELYQRYAARAAADPKIMICGRLGEYRYFDMDQAIGRAMQLARRIISGDNPRPTGPNPLRPPKFDHPEELAGTAAS